jgi:hypothetical protein
MRTMGAESSHADGQTNMTKLAVVFHIFANVPKTESIQECRIIPRNLFKG